MNEIAQASRRRRAAILAASEGLGVVATVESDEGAEGLMSSLVIEIAGEGLVDIPSSTRRALFFHSGGSIVIAVRLSPQEWPLQVTQGT